MRKTRICSALCSSPVIKCSPIFSMRSLCLFRDVGIRIPFEAVDESPVPRLLLCMHLDTSVPLWAAGRSQRLSICAFFRIVLVGCGRHRVGIAQTRLNGVFSSEIGFESLNKSQGYCQWDPKNRRVTKPRRTKSNEDNIRRKGE